MHGVGRRRGQHSLWPAGTDVPHGWAPAHGPSDRASCLAYVGAAGGRPRSAYEKFMTDT
ncbi:MULTISPECIES: MbtH family NRPS accessory protein [unclassified Streptomyces]|uniref:MbtH family NRPS accessory protein n=1 Tax=unclassified Streptomyces TaxID=2593676 RepID=UPI0024A88244|nr:MULTISPECIES: MbtH family NRPS accessory protein [unclassified Streptomyces]